MKNRQEVKALAEIHGGIPILGCLPGSPAARVGIRYGDILMTVNGEPVTSLQDFLDARLLNGNRQEVEVYRDGGLLTFVIELRDMSNVSPNDVALEIVAGRYLGEGTTESNPVN